MIDCPLPLPALSSKRFVPIPPNPGPCNLLRRRRTVGANGPLGVSTRVRSNLAGLGGESGETNGARSSFDFLELKREMERQEEEEEEKTRDSEKGEGELLVPSSTGKKMEGRRQLVRRSSLMAKQVISIHSARSLGFISQLWVDTRSWLVVLVEVRPNLLSGEVEKFLLEDLVQVGDVVLVQDESVMENELKMTGLDTLVGYSVVTPGRRDVGKVRGYTFNIYSGALESLELDSFGFSIIPASLVSTYSLLVDNIFEVASDTVVLQEGAVSRVQKVTKGIWHSSNVDISGDDMEEYYDFRSQRGRSAFSQSSRNFRSRRFPRKKRVQEDEWELPMDY